MRTARDGVVTVVTVVLIGRSHGRQTVGIGARIPSTPASENAKAVRTIPIAVVISREVAEKPQRFAAGAGMGGTAA